MLLERKSAILNIDKSANDISIWPPQSLNRLISPKFILFCKIANVTLSQSTWVETWFTQDHSINFGFWFTSQNLAIIFEGYNHSFDDYFHFRNRDIAPFGNIFKQNIAGYAVARGNAEFAAFALELHLATLVTRVLGGAGGGAAWSVVSPILSLTVSWAVIYGFTGGTGEQVRFTWATFAFHSKRKKIKEPQLYKGASKWPFSTRSTPSASLTVSLTSLALSSTLYISTIWRTKAWFRSAATSASPKN